MGDTISKLEPSSNPRKLSRVLSVGLALSFLSSVAAVTVPPALAEETRNVWVVWETSGQIPVTLVFLDWHVAQNSPDTVGCVHPVRLTVKATGDEIPLMGAALGSTACTASNTPCLPYSEVSEVFDCTPNPMFGIGALVINNPATAGVNLATLTPGCLMPFTLYVDIDGDGGYDLKKGNNYGFHECDSTV